ncbi:pseudouridine synthase [Chitinophaga sp. 30R24]|uniref:pseudouridine synthase n=1 Tax=Chitinophaga sp. 30R24 TaxID=3248838 RepID=UPI003B9055A8
MRKKQPAKKGFAPSRETKFGKSDKPAGNRNRNRSTADGERPGRTSATDKRSDDTASFRKPRFGGETQKEERPSFRKNGTTDNDRSFRKNNSATPGSDKPLRKRTYSTGKNTEERTFSDFNKKERSSSDHTAPKSNFRKTEERPHKYEKAGNDKPPRKRTYGSASQKSDDSAFHFHGDSKKGGKFASKETPSGFNRKKYFDKANERFADKQDRKRIKIKTSPRDQETDRTDRKTSKESNFGPGEMPLNKYIAHCGLCSRRKAVDFIKEGKVTVNGQVVTEPATKVSGSDTVTMQDKKIQLTKNLVYILLNKPKGYITTTDDPEGRKTVMDLIQDATENERVYPVGRLDRNTSGLLLLTNDGELAQRLAHPKHNIKKIYQVELDKALTKADFEKIIAGVTLEDGVAIVDALGYVDPKDKKQVGIEIHSGKNRIVRRIFEHLEYTVEKLDRVMYAGLTKKTLNRGQWRFLTEKEVILLKHFK